MGGMPRVDLTSHHHVKTLNSAVIIRTNCEWNETGLVGGTLVIFVSVDNNITFEWACSQWNCLLQT